MSLMVSGRLQLSENVKKTKKKLDNGQSLNLFVYIRTTYLLIKLDTKP